jgi:hypothetical protein
MRKTLISLVLCLKIFGLSDISVAAQEEVSSPSTTLDCSTTVLDVRDELEQGRDLRVVAIQVIDKSNIYPDHPRGRSLGYQFDMLGDAVDDVMNSNQLLTKLSTEIINACDTVGTVTFGLRYSDWGQTYGFMGNGKVEEFRCAEVAGRSGTRWAWGYEVCL